MKQYKKLLSIEELKALEDKDIDFSDQPELDESFWATARFVMPEERGLTQVTAKFDKEAVDWFRQQGSDYQARMNAVLRSYYGAHKGKPCGARQAPPGLVTIHYIIELLRLLGMVLPGTSHASYHRRMIKIQLNV